MSSAFQIRRAALCDPQPAPPATTVLPPASRFGHRHPAAGAACAASTDEASTAELASVQPNSQLVKNRAN